MATNREKFKIRNSLICLIKAAEGYITTVDLRNENTVTGKIECVDAYMNIFMTDATFKSWTGRTLEFTDFFIQGQNIRFVHIPDEINMRKAIENQCTAEERGIQNIRKGIRDAAWKKLQRKHKEAERIARLKQKALDLETTVTEPTDVGKASDVDVETSVK